MLKLLLFAACEKVIVDLQGQSSMVGLLEQVQVTVLKEMDPSMVTPFKWSIVTLWHREEDVPTPVKYQERMDLFRPDGVKAFQADSEFQVSNAYRNFRQNADLPFMPIGLPGEYLLKLSLKTGEQDWREIAIYPFLVIHNASADEGKNQEQETGDAER